MQAANNRDAAQLRNLAQQPKDGRTRIRIEARNRLVSDNQSRLLRQRARDRDALLLAPRQHIRAPPCILGETNPLQAVSGEPVIGGTEPPQPAAPGRNMTKPTGENVIERGQPADQVELLEHHADLPALPAAQARDGCPVELHRADVGGKQPGQAAEQRRLARAAWSQHGNQLVRVRLKAEIGQHHLAAQPLRQIPHGEQGRRNHTRRRRHQPESWSSAVTTTRMTAMMVNRREKSSRSMLFFSSWPMPPAPTTPSTVEARTLNSHQNSAVEQQDGQQVRHQREQDRGHPPGPRRSHRIERPQVGVLDVVGEVLRGTPPGVQGDTERTGERSKPDRGDEQHREHEAVDATQHVQDHPGRGVKQRHRRDVAAGQHGHRQREQRCQRGPERCHGHRLRRTLDEHRQFRDVGRPCLPEPAEQLRQAQQQPLRVDLRKPPAHGVEHQDHGGDEPGLHGDALTDRRRSRPRR